jgi:imidazoleglycerol phosphate synthase glutamine amidotransferase subunit HisH
MGWNSIEVKNRDPILSEISGNDRFYFVHSYHISNIEERKIIGTTTYGYGSLP